jgi:ferredoxin
MNNSINQSLCVKCKLCIAICPVNIITINNQEQVDFIREREHICLKCGQCMSICTSEAIKIKGINYKTDLFDLPKETIAYPQLINFFSHRRSVRNFKDKPVPQEIIEKIISAINFAPYGAKPEKMHITVINNRKKIESILPDIEKFLEDIIKWIENPIISYFIRKKTNKETFNTIKKHLYPIAKTGNYQLKYGDRITRDAPAILVFHAEKDAEEHTNNGLIYATYVMMAAQSLGLGATIIGLVPPAINKVEKIRNKFRIPKRRNRPKIRTITVFAFIRILEWFFNHSEMNIFLSEIIFTSFFFSKKPHQRKPISGNFLPE